MHAPLTPSAKLRILADDIVSDTSREFHMGSSATCAYNFAWRRFGYEGDDNMSHQQHLAKILGISLELANYIYSSTGYGDDRAAVARMLRSEANVLEHSA
jgi:hypothetical protein